jgi:rhodanese-related sulfurtransferase
LFGLHLAGRATSGSEQQSGGQLSVDVREALALCTQGAQLVDVREPFEYISGHARGAKNIPLGDLLARKGELDPSTTLLVICQSGVRSATGQRQLLKEAFTDVRNVRGGTSAWQSAGLPMDR